MGNGYRDGQFLNFQVTADYDLTDDDRGRWERAFAKASEILWNATEGQLRFGTVLFTDQNAGATNAELILNADTGGRALGTSGGWGQSGKAKAPASRPIPCTQASCAPTSGLKTRPGSSQSSAAWSARS